MWMTLVRQLSQSLIVATLPLRPPWRGGKTIYMKGDKKANLVKMNVDKAKDKRKKKKSARGARAMSCDYTATQQLQDNSDNLVKGPADPAPGIAGNCEPPSLHLIFQTMMLQHKQIQSDNKKARVASKQLQVSVSKIAKTCSEIGERIATVETRTSILETDVVAVAQQSAMHESQLIDIQWKSATTQ
ncbi:hypothetical protein NDU88_000918 [Pleurodeles waltl]|uniref:Uncharacterized protein n=1 Tax=Pleurodeles waltl TaxID=8319 RepID=A0AAV7LZJ1_PLEWA|nr:hypothetical protein NDU88_000918 [Pleurodeles waltl]